MRFNVINFTSAFTNSVGLMAPVLLAAALVSMYLAAGSIKSASASIAVNVKDQSEKAISVVKDPITARQAQVAAQRLNKVAPSVEVALMGPDLVVSSTDVNRYAEFMHALSVVQSTLPDVAWEARDICLGKCEGNKVAQAVIRGYSQSFKTIDGKK